MTKFTTKMKCALTVGNNAMAKVSLIKQTTAQPPQDCIPQQDQAKLQASSLTECHYQRN